MKKIIMVIFAFSFLGLAVLPALAVQPDEMLSDAAQESRAREISRDIRCLVCQGEAIDESNAELAGDLRRLVRQRIRSGDSDAEVLAYLKDRYGDYILLNPPFKPETLVLWFLPPVMLLGGGVVVWRSFLRRKGRGGL